MNNLSPQQAAAVAAVKNNRGSIVVEAVAGAGKTSTLIRMLEVTKGSVAFCAFNKAIANEISYKVGDKFGDRVKIGTVHSFGFGAIRRAVSRVKVDGNKLRSIAQTEFTGEYANLQQFVTSAAAMAKECGIAACIENDVQNWRDMFDHYSLWDSMPNGISETTAIDASQYLLKCSNSLKNIVDFSDMIYLPILHNMKIWQYDYIFLDEAQDTNSTRRALVKMMLKPNGRLVAVGDPHQAIYGFTGADHSALDSIRQEFNAVTMPLSVTFRCPKSVVKMANQWVDHIQADESAPEGVVDSCELAEVVKFATQDDAIICRNTKPLVSLAYSLLRQSVPCKVEGRAIGEGLIKLAQRWKTVKNVGELAEKVDMWKDNEIAKHKKKGNDSRCQIVEDQAETLGVFIDQCDESDAISVLVGKIRALFSDTQEGDRPILTLSTIHRAKGREWNRVFALGMDVYSPSKWARQAWELQQEDNLCYVQVTRAKQHLTMVNVPAKDS
jgi:superfamily I DNA/RNA helicase